MEQHEIKEATKRVIEIRNNDGVLVDPDTVAISVMKPDRTLDVSDVAMSTDETGIYYYWYVISDQVGIHKIRYVATTGVLPTVQRDEFEAVSEWN